MERRALRSPKGDASNHAARHEIVAARQIDGSAFACGASVFTPERYGAPFGVPRRARNAGARAERDDGLSAAPERRRGASFGREGLVCENRRVE